MWEPTAPHACVCARTNAKLCARVWTREHIRAHAHKSQRMSFDMCARMWSCVHAHEYAHTHLEMCTRAQKPVHEHNQSATRGALSMNAKFSGAVPLEIFPNLYFDKVEYTTQIRK